MNIMNDTLLLTVIDTRLEYETKGAKTKYDANNGVDFVTCNQQGSINCQKKR